MMLQAVCRASRRAPRRWSFQSQQRCCSGATQTQPQQPDFATRVGRVQASGLDVPWGFLSDKRKVRAGERFQRMKDTMESLPSMLSPDVQLSNFGYNLEDTTEGCRASYLHSVATFNGFVPGTKWPEFREQAAGMGSALARLMFAQLCASHEHTVRPTVACEPSGVRVSVVNVSVLPRKMKFTASSKIGGLFSALNGMRNQVLDLNVWVRVDIADETFSLVDPLGVAELPNAPGVSDGPVGDDDDDEDDKPVATPGFHLLRFVAKSDAEPGIGSLFAGSDLTFGDFQLADMNDTLIEHM